MTSLVRTDPFDTAFRDFFRNMLRPTALELEATPEIRLDLKETEKAYTVHAEIPGVKKEDIRIGVDGAQVTLEAEVKQEREAGKDERVLHVERTYGKATRSFTLPQELDEAKVEAKYRDGVLELTLPKKAATSAKRLAVQ